MAQTYLEIVRESLETQYGKGTAPLMSLAALNSKVRFIAVPVEGSESLNSGDQFLIQRLKRVKGEATKQDATVGGGTNFVARLDAAKRVAWDTVATKASNKKDVMIRMADKQDKDIIESGSPYEKSISNSIIGSMIDSEETNLEAIITGITAGAAIDITTATDTAKKQAIIDAIEKDALNLELLVDDYKAYSDNIITFIHPEVAKLYADIQGQSYQNGTNTFPEGFKGGFRYNGRDFIVHPLLNALSKATAYITMDAEAFASAGFETLLKSWDEKYLDERFVGHSFAELSAIVDSLRIKHAPLITSIAKTKKVNA